MARRRYDKSDSRCYYGNKLMGRATDGYVYAALMDECGDDAARILREYAYFSPELKAILEKVAALQAKQARTVSGNPDSMFTFPKQSPWGEIQHCDFLCPGVFMVTTAGHGGTMVTKEAAAFLSRAAVKCGFRKDGYICFEEDAQEGVALRELLDKGLWEIPDRIKDKAAYIDQIDKSLQKYNPDYWRARQNGIDRAARRESPRQK